MDLLRALLVFAERDSGAPGFTGKLAFGVQADEGVSWVQIHVGREARAELVAAPADDTDAALLMGEAEANALIAGRPLPEQPRFVRYGDRVLISRFVERYVRRRSPLAARIQGAR